MPIEPVQIGICVGFVVIIALLLCLICVPWGPSKACDSGMCPLPPTRSSFPPGAELDEDTDTPDAPVARLPTEESFLAMSEHDHRLALMNPPNNKIPRLGAAPTTAQFLQDMQYDTVRGRKSTRGTEQVINPTCKMHASIPPEDNYLRPPSPTGDAPDPYSGGSSVYPL